jgi:hypothetical protein
MEPIRKVGWIGIDPGASGAIAVYDHGYDISVIKLTETPQDVSSWLAEKIEQYHIMGAVIERVHAMPKQGVVSGFKFGVSYGFCQGLLVAHRIPFEMITPQTWQKELRCLTKGDKNITKEAAQRIWPKLSITHATADAMLIALYARVASSFRERTASVKPVKKNR